MSLEQQLWELTLACDEKIYDLQQELERLKECIATGDREVIRLRTALGTIQMMAENGDYGIAALAKEALCSTQ